MTQRFRKSYSHHTIGFVPLILCLVLGGCSTTSETFDCKAGQGVGCKSISEVNQMVDHGGVGNGVGTRMPEKDIQSILPLSDTRVSGMHASGPVISADSRLVDHFESTSSSYSSEIPLSDTMAVRRIPEQHLRVWVAPFQDAHGNFHEGSIVHTVLKSSFWQINATDTPISDSSDDKVVTRNLAANSSEEVD